ncbi:hypothetical protein [Parashewanella tropica]|uniref:hypothetical protein n=1 Tax=Parashewanella tropica TaxID=2547970 RepID=UPI00105A58A7|nr:hypothetical protein [Parashewanella tropica]
MKTIKLLFFLTYIFSSVTQASLVNDVNIVPNKNGTTTCVYPGNIYYLNSQNDADEFAIKYSQCSTFNGTIFVQQNVHNLPNLPNLKTIDGSLYVLNQYDLKNFKGLAALEHITKDFYVVGNSGIVNFSGLSNLTNVSGEFEMLDNYNLVDFQGLDNLKQVGTLTIIRNDNLDNIKELNKLKSVTTALTLYHNASLNTIKGLNNLSRVGQIHIQNNSKLLNITALSNAKYTKNDRHETILQNNPNLKECSGLCYLKKNAFNFVVENNADACQDYFSNCVK